MGKVHMSFEERNAYVGILSSVIAWGVMLSYLWPSTVAGAFDGPEGPQVWARLVLWLIALSIGITIAVTVLFNITYALWTGERNFAIARDERDKGIGLRAMQVAQIVMATGIVLAIVLLAMGGGIALFLNAVLAACAIASLASELTKIILYRRGF